MSLNMTQKLNNVAYLFVTVSLDLVSLLLHPLNTGHTYCSKLGHPHNGQSLLHWYEKKNH